MTSQAPSGPDARDAATSDGTETTDAYPSHWMDEEERSGNATTAATKAAPATIGPMTPKLIAALESRGLDIELLAMLGVGALSKPGGDWLGIPYLENGVRVGCKHRTVGARKMFAQDTGSRQILWNVDCLRDQTLKDDPVIITEGEFDAVAAMQCGFPRTVSVPGGAPNEQIGQDKTGKKYAFLDAAEPLLRDVREFILAVDGDGPGANLLADLAMRLGKAKCKWVKFPKRCKDLNDVLVQWNPDILRETIRRAQWYPVPGIYRMADLPPPDEQPALHIGIDGFEDDDADKPKFLARRGDLWVISGVPGHGKSSLANEICCRLAWRHSWSSMFASFEQDPQTDHRRALRSFHASKAQRDMTPAEIAEADKWIGKHFSFMVPSEDDDVDLEWVLDRSAVAVRQYNADALVIDPWNEMDHVRPPGMSLTEYTGYAIKQFKRFARKHRVLMIVVAHPAKLQRGKDGKYPIPSLYDVSDSSHWANKPDVGIIVHRDTLDAGGVTKIRIPKVRYHGVIGVPGDIDGLKWNRQTTRYAAPPKERDAQRLPYRDDDL